MHRRGELDALSSVGICWLLSPFPRQHNLSGLPVLRICGSPFFTLYIGYMVLRSSRGRPLNAPAAFIHPCQPAAVAIPLYTVRNIDSGAGPYR